jgi:predicted DNA-binding protein
MKRKPIRIIPESDRKKNQIAVRLTDKELQDLGKISQKEGLPISYYVREGITLVIRQYLKQ